MSTTNMIGISEDRMRHMPGVARKAYRLSLETDGYLTACDICFQTGLTAVNLTAGIT